MESKAGLRMEEKLIQLKMSVQMKFSLNLLKSLMLEHQPGCVDGWFELHEKFGKIRMEEILAPAIDYAKNGFVELRGLYFF